MLSEVVVLGLLSAILRCSGERNIYLLENEVVSALKACAPKENSKGPATISSKRERRWNRNVTIDQYYDQYPRVYNSKDLNIYSHQRRNTSDMYQNISNMTKNDILDYENQYGNENFNSTPRKHSNNSSRNNYTLSSRKKRNEQLIKHETDQVN